VRGCRQTTPVIGRKPEASDAVRVRVALGVPSSTESPSHSPQSLGGSCGDYSSVLGSWSHEFSRSGVLLFWHSTPYERAVSSEKPLRHVILQELHPIMLKITLQRQLAA